MTPEKIQELDELYEKNLKLQYENTLEYQRQLKNTKFIFKKLDQFLDMEMNRSTKINTMGDYEMINREEVEKMINDVLKRKKQEEDE